MKIKLSRRQLQYLVEQASDWYDDEKGYETMADMKYADSLDMESAEDEMYGASEYDRGYQDGYDALPPARDATADYDIGYEAGNIDGNADSEDDYYRMREAIDVMNLETGEVKVFGDDEYSDLPDAAWPDLVKRLSLNPQDDGVDMKGNQNYGLSDEDFEKLSMEIDGKPADREVRKRIKKFKEDEARLDPDRLLDRLSDWAKMAADDYMADNQEFPDTHLQDIAWDLASGAKYEFAQDEWDELVWHFDGNEDHVIEYAAGSMG